MLFNNLLTLTSYLEYCSFNPIKILTSEGTNLKSFISAHPNVKLFISHGGLLGLSEAVYEGVPILGIPIFGDQRTNLKNIVMKGAGETLEYNEISNENVLERILTLLNNPQ